MNILSTPILSNANLFSQMYSQIQSELLGSGTQYFQMFGDPISFDWPVAPTGQLSLQAYQIMSAAPAYSPVGLFGGVGVSTLFDNYRQVFSHVGFKLSPQQQQQVRQLSDQAQSAQNALNAVWTNANTAYLTAKQNGGAIFAAEYPSIQDWLKGPGATYTQEATTYKKQIEQIFANIQSLNEANQPTTLQQALDAMQMPSGDPGTTPAPRGWTKVPNSAGALEWQPVFDIATNSQNWRAQLTDGSIGAKSLTLTASQSDSSINKTWAGASFSVQSFFWGVKANGAWTRTDLSAHDQSVVATVHMESATVVNITPGAWYDGGFLRQMATAGNTGTGYQILDPYTATGGSHPLFGKGGLCATMVNGLVVVYKPSFSITMQESTYQKFQQQIDAATDVRIGCFTFGGSGGNYQQKVDTNAGTTTITSESTSDDPIIVGVTVGFPGTDAP